MLRGVLSTFATNVAQKCWPQAELDRCADAVELFTADEQLKSVDEAKRKTMFWGALYVSKSSPERPSMVSSRLPGRIIPAPRCSAPLDTRQRLGCGPCHLRGPTRCAAFGACLPSPLSGLLSLRPPRLANVQRGHCLRSCRLLHRSYAFIGKPAAYAVSAKIARWANRYLSPVSAGLCS